MKTPAIVCMALLMSLPAIAEAKERCPCRAHPQRVERIDRHASTGQKRLRHEERGRTATWRDEDDGFGADTPYGPKYQTQEQELRSRYDFAAGRTGNIREYWWRY